VIKLPAYFPPESPVLRELAMSIEDMAKREAHRAGIRERMAMHAAECRRLRAERDQQPILVDTYA
jgi:hypothetical protein